jgi:hypothetical protein
MIKTAQELVASGVFDKAPDKRTFWEAVSSKMMIHTSAIVPEELIRETRKGDPEAIIQNKIDKYDPFTNDGILKAIDKASRIFRDSKYSITFGANAAQAKKYYEEGRLTQSDGQDVSVKDWVFKFLFRKSIDDPNAVRVTLPVHPEGDFEPHYESIAFTGEEYKVIAPDFDEVTNEQINVTSIIVPSIKLWYVGDGLLAYEDPREWVYEEGDSPSSKPFYWILDREMIWLYVPVSVGSELEYFLVRFYNHAQGEVPFSVLGGNWCEALGVYDSFFAPYAHWGHKAIRRQVDYDTIMDLNGYPVKVLRGQKCTSCKGSGRVEENGKMVECSTCHGTGQTYDISPSSVYKKPQKQYNELEEDGLPVKWAEPPTNILRHLREDIDALLKRAEKSISVTFTDSAQSGEAKRIDRENLYDLMYKMSEHVFSELEALLVHSAMYLELAEKPEVNVRRPQDFAIRGFEELVQERKDLQNAGASRLLCFRSEMELLKKRYPGEYALHRMLEVQFMVDPLYGASKNPHKDHYKEEDFAFHNTLQERLTLLSIEMGERFYAPDSLPEIITKIKS